MLQVLIVDDEPLIRQGLLTRLRSLSPETEAREAQDAQSALALLAEQPAQIVIADIQMPGMDGLQLIAEIKRRWTETQFIILSGYAEFAYAQRAIQLGVQDYLLKPISTRELGEALEHVAGRVLSARSSGAEITHLRNRLDSLHLQQGFYRLIGGTTLPQREAQALQERLFPCQPLLLCLLLVSGPKTQREPGAARPLADEVAALLPSIPESRAPHLFAHIMNASRMLYLVFPCPDAGDEAAAAELLERLLGRLDARGLCVAAGVSAPAPLLSREAAQQAGAALQRRLLYGMGRVYRRGAPSSREVSQQLSRDLADLQAALHITDFRSAEAALMRIFSPEHVPDASGAYVWTAYLNVMSTLALSAELQSPELDASPLDRFDTREEFLQHLRMLLRSASAPRSAAEDKRSERIRHAIEYVRRHYSENLTLNGLSYQYALSPNYFSTVFKEVTGMGVVNFLTSVRMENACYMLTHTGLSVGSIAHNAGYADAQYFFQVFKKNMGVTPVQYRKLHAATEKEEKPGEEENHTT